MTMQLILASSSPYRKSLLKRLGLSFSCMSPDIDETRLPDETPDELVRRLALEKAQAVGINNSKALIIGSDQVAVIANEVLTKPGDRNTAIAQLQRQSGNTVIFLTSVCVLDAATNQHDVDVVPVKVSFRELSQAEIERYVSKEQPWDCAGSFKSEGYGITLLKTISTTDSTALIGLPLIRTAELLRAQSLKLP